MIEFWLCLVYSPFSFLWLGVTSFLSEELVCFLEALAVLFGFLASLSFSLF